MICVRVKKDGPDGHAYNFLHSRPICMLQQLANPVGGAEPVLIPTGDLPLAERQVFSRCMLFQIEKVCATECWVVIRAIDRVSYARRA